MPRILVFGIVTLSLGLTTGCFEEPDPASIQSGEIAPAMAGFDAKHEPVALSDFRGQVVLLDFWATWCQPCRQSLPKYQKLSEKYQGRPFTVLGISGDSSPQDLADYLKDHPEYDWPNIFDGEKRTFFNAWKVQYLPTVHLIDAKGVIRHKHLQMKSDDEVARLVDELVREAESEQSSSS